MLINVLCIRNMCQVWEAQGMWDDWGLLSSLASWNLVQLSNALPDFILLFLKSHFLAYVLCPLDAMSLLQTAAGLDWIHRKGRIWANSNTSLRGRWALLQRLSSGTLALADALKYSVWIFAFCWNSCTAYPYPKTRGNLSYVWEISFFDARVSSARVQWLHLGTAAKEHDPSFCYVVATNMIAHSLHWSTWFPEKELFLGIPEPQFCHFLPINSMWSEGSISCNG